MHEKLQKITDLIQHSKRLDAEQKENLLKAVKDADQEMEITAFKLERTEKVKKTTAILLEETIEELEQKRKAVEEQNRELEIESALERTRTQSMVMQHSSELNNVSNVFHEQLLSLGIPSELSYVWLPDEENQNHLFWATWSEETKGSTATQSKSISHPLDKTEPYTAACFAMWESGVPVHIKRIQPSEVGEFFDSWKELLSGAKKLKPKYFPEGLYYAEAYMNYGCFGINIRRELTDEEKEILRRFAVEFERAYTRFLDLKKAEQQTREAQIELSLERIRAQATAMKESADLLDIVVTMRKEFVALGHEAHYFWHMRWLPDKYEKAMTSGDGTRIGMVMALPRHIHGDIKLLADWEKSDEPAVVYAMDAEAAIDYVSKMIDLGDFEQVDPNAPTLDDIRHIGGLTFVMARTTHGEIGYSLPGMVPNPPADDLAELLRFTGVFDLAYRRFEDLKEAEAQAREAIKQASLDRVRAEIASMRTAEDLNRITPVIWRELTTLEVPFIRCGVFIVDEMKEKLQAYLTTPGGKSLGVLDLSFDANEMTSQTVDYWRRKEVYTTHWNRKDFVEWTESMIKLGQVQNAETYQGSAKPPKSLDLYFVPFTQGMLYVGDVSPLTDEKLELVKTLAEAFAIAYARYEDFRNLEEAKNKIEITLDELREAQAQLVHSEKMASLGELTAGIAHEIKNPLNFVNNFSEISRELLDELTTELQNNNEEDAAEIMKDLGQNLEKINQHGKRADSIVKGMLLHSRGTSGEKSLTDINDLLDQYVNLAYHGIRAQNKEFNVTIEKDYDDTLEKIEVVPQDISRVLLNIINNACYAAYDKKKKSSDNHFSPTLSVSTKELNGKVEIRIGDNGAGIPAEIIDKIFQPFFTTKPTGEGTGLGLSLSYDIVTQVHGGELKVETTSSESLTAKKGATTGTVFIICLPI